MDKGKLCTDEKRNPNLKLRKEEKNLIENKRPPEMY